MNDLAKINFDTKEIQLEIKKATMKSWAGELFKMNWIDEKRYFQMMRMIDCIKQ